MDTVTIDSKRPFSLELIQRTIAPYWPIDTSYNTLCVTGPGSRVYLHVDTTPEVEGMHRLLVDYSDVALAKSVVEKIADDSDVTVDNGFGTILPGNEFVARIQTEKGWNWRPLPPPFRLKKP